jgi:hypothetical protein
MEGILSRIVNTFSALRPTKAQVHKIFVNMASTPACQGGNLSCSACSKRLQLSRELRGRAAGVGKSDVGTATKSLTA